MLHGIWDPSSLTRVQTHTPASEVESQPLDCQGSPSNFVFIITLGLAMASIIILLFDEENNILGCTDFHQI